MEKRKRIGVEKWAASSYNSFHEALIKHYPQGMSHCCDGTPLERGLEKKSPCRYFYNGKCLNSLLARPRTFAEKTAKRLGLVDE